MKKFYFFKSSKEHDVINSISVFTDNSIKAFKYAKSYFVKQKCKGIPQLLSI